MTGISSYDSGPETRAHISRVRVLLRDFAEELDARGISHDSSKLEEPEKSAFDLLTPRLRLLEYGSPEYKASLAELGLALQHHYSKNPHHPEAKVDGIAGFSLIDLVECFLDWKAASERLETGDIRKSIELNVERFGIEPQLASILRNTVAALGWDAE